MPSLMNVDGRICEKVGEFKIIVVQYEDGTKAAVMEGDDEMMILEGVLLAVDEIKKGFEQAEELRPWSEGNG